MVQVNGHIIFCNNKILNKKTIVKKKKSVFLKFFKLRRLDGQQLTHRINLRPEVCKQVDRRNTDE